MLVTFAVDAEFAPWRKRHAFEQVSMPMPVGFRGIFFYRGTVFENEVDVLLTGIGWEEGRAENSTRYVLRELLRSKLDLCISSGLAGGLRSDLRCGDIVAGREVGLGTGGDTFRSSVKLLAIAKDAGARIDLKQITETHIVSEATAKSALANFGDFVDMEGFYILQIVSGARIPMISVRAISDTYDEDLPPEIDKVVNREGHVKTVSMLKLILKRPGQIPALLRFGSQSRGAALSLADFLDDFLQTARGGDSEAQAKREAVAAQ